MDISSIMNALLSDESVKSLGKKSGADTQTVENILQSALPMLLKGASEQAGNKKTAESFAGALTQHAKNDTSNLGAFLDGIDLEDGAKIVAHLLGSENTDKKAAVSKKSGADSKTTATVLSMAAPMLMSLLGKQTAKEDSKADVGSLMGNLLSGVDVGDVASLLLGKKKKGDGLNLGDVAGQLGKLLK